MYISLKGLCNKLIVSTLVHSYFLLHAVHYFMMLKKMLNEKEESFPFNLSNCGRGPEISSVRSRNDDVVVKSQLVTVTARQLNSALDKAQENSGHDSRPSASSSA